MRATSQEEPMSKETNNSEIEYEEEIDLSITPEKDVKNNDEDKRITKLINYINNYLAKHNTSETLLKKTLKEKGYICIISLDISGSIFCLPIWTGKT